jgi:outer membrane immunogenic protein
MSMPCNNLSMRKAVLTLSILCALSAFAFAGPEPSGKDMKQIAPMPPACPNWTGFYVGGFAGYKFGTIDPNIDLAGTWNLTPGDVTAVEAVGREDLDGSGAEVGGLIGYNYQWNKWVLGVEATGGYTWLAESRNVHFFAPSGDEFNLSTSFESHFLGTFGPRIGYAFCKWLPYVTGGLAFGELDFTQSLDAFDFGLFPRGSENEINVGWFVGGGLQYAITDHWSVRAQYQYIDLGEVEFDHENTLPAYPVHGEAELREHNASFAIIYGF